MSNNIYCTYFTFYSGNKLPPFYIGSSSVESRKKMSEAKKGKKRGKYHKAQKISDACAGIPSTIAV